ncbi:MAG: protein-L-isoaspartate O-methyltransferase [Pseudomonadota bacterium]
MDFEQARIRMVDNQIRTTDVTSHPVLDAFLSVPRENFVPMAMRALAYIDDDILLHKGEDGLPGRYVMEPSPLAKLLQLASVGKTDVVLEIGCATGYVSALISLLADSVVALESDVRLADMAGERLSDMGYDNVAVVTGPLAEGYQPEAPYDVIFIGGSVEELPHALFDQLRSGGRLVVVEGHGNASQANLYVRDGNHTSARHAFNTSVRPLPGFGKKIAFDF